eukprot:Em0001g368a
MVQDGLKHAVDKEVAFRRGIPCNLLGLPGGFRPKVGGATANAADLSTTVRARAAELIGMLTSHLQEETSVQTYSKDFIASSFHLMATARSPRCKRADAAEVGFSCEGPMPSLKDTVVLCWPDHTYLFEGCDEEDQRWAFVYHSLNNPRDTHMVASADGQECKPSGVKFPVPFRGALKELFFPPGRTVKASELATSSDEDRQCILTTLWAEGLIRVVL